jgi:hypothetical protein
MPKRTEVTENTGMGHHVTRVVRVTALQTFNVRRKEERRKEGREEGRKEGREKEGKKGRGEGRKKGRRNGPPRDESGESHSADLSR